MLAKEVNEVSEFNYRYYASPSLGRTTTKEQYVIFYCEPGQLMAPEIADQELSFITLHTKPTDAFGKIKQLATFTDQMERKHLVDPIIIGDLNAV